MNSVTRHPSAPRKSPPPPPRALPNPVVVCAACKDPVVPNVQPGPSWIVAVVLFFMAIIPAILYLIWFELRKRTAVTCPQCGGTDLVPMESTRGREIIGERWDAVQGVARKLAVDAARAQAESLNDTRRQIRIASFVAAGILVALVLGGLVIYRGSAKQRAALAAQAEESQKAQAAADAARAEREAAVAAMRRPPSAADGLALPSKEVTISADGAALEHPRSDAAPSWRVTAGETYVIAEERDGWIRLQADVPAWVEAKAVTR